MYRLCHIPMLNLDYGGCQNTHAKVVEGETDPDDQ